MKPLAGERLRLRFGAEGRLPVTYREGLQAALYRALPPPLGEALHDHGLVPGPRPLKLFVFSRLLGLRYLREEKAFLAQGELILLLRLRFAAGGGGPPPRGLGAGGPRRSTASSCASWAFFNPLNREFSLLAEANLNRKAQALGLEEGRLAVKPLGFRPQNKRLERYTETWVEGWMGRYRLRGTPHLVRLALLSGLGSKNSQGFGFVREVEGC